MCVFTAAARSWIVRSIHATSRKQYHFNEPEKWMRVVKVSKKSLPFIVHPNTAIPKCLWLTGGFVLLNEKPRSCYFFLLPIEMFHSLILSYFHSQLFLLIKTVAIAIYSEKLFWVLAMRVECNDEDYLREVLLVSEYFLSLAELKRAWSVCGSAWSFRLLSGDGNLKKFEEISSKTSTEFHKICFHLSQSNFSFTYIFLSLFLTTF